MMAKRSSSSSSGMMKNNKLVDDGRGATSNNSGSGDNRKGGAAAKDGLVIIYNVMANRSVPIVFILVSSLIIANISCDQVGSANELDLTPVADGYESTASGGGGGGNNSAAPAKYDPLNMLREIYLDHNSKVITLLSSPSATSVQKFHPNGRYGRRSVDNNLAEAPGAHTELAKLRLAEDELDGDTMPLRSPYSSWDRINSDAATSGSQDQLDATNKRHNQLRWLLTNKSSGSSSPQSRSLKAIGDKKTFEPSSSAAAAGGDMSASFRQELNKLLKCNYSGVSNLFWCNS